MPSLRRFPSRYHHPPLLAQGTRQLGRGRQLPPGGRDRSAGAGRRPRRDPGGRIPPRPSPDPIRARAAGHGNLRRRASTRSTAVRLTGPGRHVSRQGDRGVRRIGRSEIQGNRRSGCAGAARPGHSLVIGNGGLHGDARPLPAQPCRPRLACRPSTLFPVALHRVGRQRDDGDVTLGSLLSVWRITGGLEPVHLGHLAVHEDEIVRDALEGQDGLLAVRDDVGSIAALVPQPLSKPLIDSVVPDHQDPASDHRRRRSARLPALPAGAVRDGHRRGQDLRQALQERAGPDGLREIDADPGLPARLAPRRAAPTTSAGSGERPFRSAPSGSRAPGPSRPSPAFAGRG